MCFQAGLELKRQNILHTCGRWTWRERNRMSMYTGEHWWPGRRAGGLEEGCRRRVSLLGTRGTFGDYHSVHKTGNTDDSIHQLFSFLPGNVMIRGLIMFIVKCLLLYCLLCFNLNRSYFNNVSHFVTKIKSIHWPWSSACHF